ncbi:MAG: hypothetical protein KDJ38_16330, partial [Gammaproteobacteria bacterium]|nr:hypothetical protein [Gammaproteobacteria bacterium]
MKTTTISAGMLAVSLSGLFAFANDTLLLEPSPDEGSLAGEPVIRVSGIDDVHVLRTDTTKKSISVLNQACIFTSGMRYGVRALESENRFNLSNGITRLPYTVTFNGQRLD